MKVTGIPELNNEEMISCIKCIFGKERADIAIKRYTSGEYMEIKPPKELMRTLNTMKRYASTDFERIVINKLIGDRKLHKKIAFVSDGSFINNRIAAFDSINDYMWPTEERINLIEFINSDLVYGKKAIDRYGYTKEEIKAFYNKFKTLSLKRQITSIYNSFDHIFIHWLI